MHLPFPIFSRRESDFMRRYFPFLEEADIEACPDGYYHLRPAPTAKSADSTGRTRED
jgi:hypothetical protein